MKVMVFAAGKGTRLGELTQKTPKPLIALGDTSPLMRTLKLLSEAGFKDVVVNVSYLREQIIAALTPAPYGLKITISDEGDEALETAGGVINVLDYLGDAPFMCVNADAVWPEETAQVFKKLPAAFDKTRMKGMLAAVRFEDAVYHGQGDFIIDEEGRIVFTLGQPAPYVYIGVQILNPAAFRGLEPGKRGLGSLYRQWAAEGRLYGLPVTGPWVDMGTPEGLEAARKMLMKKPG